MQRHIGSEVRVAAVVAYRQALLFLLVHFWNLFRTVHFEKLG